MAILTEEYYQNPDVLFLSRNLLGKYLLTTISGVLAGGMIIETEAYRAPEDKASHAFGNRRTKRNEVMYHKGGISYVYLVYGLHYLFNIVTNVEGIPHAVLIRAITPEIGIDEMVKRRGKAKLDASLCKGPGSVAEALGITINHNGLPLDRPPIWVEDRGVVIQNEEIITGPRVGVDYAEEHALLPWRFQINKSKRKSQ